MITLTNRHGVFHFDPTESWDLIEDGMMILTSEESQDVFFHVGQADVMELVTRFIKRGERPVSALWRDPRDGDNATTVDWTETALLAVVQAFVEAARMKLLVPIN